MLSESNSDDGFKRFAMIFIVRLFQHVTQDNSISTIVNICIIWVRTPPFHSTLSDGIESSSKLIFSISLIFYSINK